jgi:hypothetical protein
MNVAKDDPTGTETLEDDLSGEPLSSELHSFTSLIDSIDGFTGNLHSNYTNATDPTYRCTLVPANYVHLDVKGGTMSSSGMVGTEAKDKINNHGGTAISNAPKKIFFSTDYNTLYNKAKAKSSFISLDDNVPSIATFLGKMRNNGGTLEGRVSIIGIKKWVNITDIPIIGGNGLPDGMSWDSGTGTLTIDEGKNYKWDDDLDLSGVNINVQGTKGSGLFVNGNITANNIEITAKAFCLASNDRNITLNNARLNITATDSSDGVGLYTKNLTITTDPTKIPAGGNKFKGIVYANGGTIDLTNQYTGLTDNSLTLEGLVLNPKSAVAVTPRLKVKNKGSDNFKIELKYNPYVANSMIDYANAKVKLQTLYWEID